MKAADIKQGVDPFAIGNYSTYLWYPKPRTPLCQVEKLEYGCALIVHNGHAEGHWRFYELPFRQPIVALSESDATDQTRRTMRTTVQRQMVSDVQVGVFLSGGLDSSTVVALTRLQCFSVVLNNRDAFQRRIWLKREFHGLLFAAVPLPPAVARRVASEGGYA